MTDPVLVLVPLETLRVGEREVVVVDVPDGASLRSWVGRLARIGGRSVRITGVGTFALPDGATFRRCDLVVEDAPDDIGEQVSVRQFSCIHGVEPDGWCAQCDPEESARYLDSLGGGFVSDQRAGACRVCGRMDIAVTQVPGYPGDVCVDEAACFVEFRRREGWDALARLVDLPDGGSRSEG